MTISRALTRRRILGAAAVTGAALGLAGCGGGGNSGSDGAPTREFDSDHKDSPVEIPKEPTRVVAIGWAVTALISVKGVNLAGVTRGTQDTSLTAAELRKVKGLTQVGKDLEINVEKIADLRPDLIVSGLAAAMDYDYGDLEQIAPVAVAAMNQPAEWKDMNARVADAAGVKGAHGELIDEYDRRAAELRDTYADQLDGKLFAAVDAFGDGKWTLEHQNAHGTSVPADAGLRFTKESEDGKFSESLPFEKLDRLDGYDVVLTRANDDGDPTPQIQKLMDQGPWKELKPVDADRVFPVPHLGAMSYTAGVELLDELEEHVLKKL